jgi:hypothetical protein
LPLNDGGDTTDVGTVSLLALVELMDVLGTAAATRDGSTAPNSKPPAESGHARLMKTIRKESGFIRSSSKQGVLLLSPDRPRKRAGSPALPLLRGSPRVCEPTIRGFWAPLRSTSYGPAE